MLDHRISQAVELGPGLVHAIQIEARYPVRDVLGGEIRVDDPPQSRMAGHAMSRDRDVRNAARDLLMATGYFTEVDLGVTPSDYASGVVGADSIKLEPVDSTHTPEWDRGGLDGVIMVSRVRLTIIVRDEDPVVRDERAEKLLDVVLDTLSDVSLAGITFPAFNRWTAIRWEKPVHPERKLMATLEYRYLVSSSQSFDTSE